MPKPRHENPHAERLIAHGQLRGWLSRRELEQRRQAEAAALEKRERERAELAAKRARADRLAAEAARLERRARRVLEWAGGTAAGRRRAAELATEAATVKRVARQAEALVPVPWSDLSPAELAYRWMVDHHHEPRFDLATGDYIESDYTKWCRESRAAWARKNER